MPFRADIDLVPFLLNKKEIKKALVAGAKLVATEAKKEITASSAQGRRYGSHRASAPGQAPASRSGHLASSIKARAGAGTSATVIDSAWYALPLEKGAEGGGGTKGSRNKRGQTMTPRHLAARPFMEVALDRMKPKIDALVQAAANQSVEEDK